MALKHPYIPVAVRNADVVESDLHKKMKASVETQLARGEYYRTEWFMGNMGEDPLRVDAYYTRNKRYYLVECETRPNIKRLHEKARRRKRIPYRTVYILIVPINEYWKRDWRQLRGDFDQVYGYEEDSDTLREVTDLRVFGKAQDIFLDRWMPIRRTHVKKLYWWLIIWKNLAKTEAQILIQCSMCKLDLDPPWEYCIKTDCPDSHYPYMDDRVNFHFKSSNL